MTLFLALACGPSVATLDAPADTAGGDSADSADTDQGGEHVLELVINEFMAENAESYIADDGSSPDWIELYNRAEYDVDIEGYLLRDDLESDEPWAISGSLVVPAGGFLLLFADGETGQGPDHLGFALDSGGEQLGLYTAEDKPLDLLEFGAQVRDTSLARLEDGVEGEWAYVPLGTPGASNE